LDVEKRVVRVHLAREHAPELEHFELLRHACHLADDVRQRAGVLLFARELVQLGGFVERLLDFVQSRDDALELGALAP
jgi:hypothetical protein